MLYILIHTYYEHTCSYSILTPSKINSHEKSEQVLVILSACIRHSKTTTGMNNACMMAEHPGQFS